MGTKSTCIDVYMYTEVIYYVASCTYTFTCIYKWAYIMIYYIVHVLPDPRGVYRAYVEYMQLTRVALSFGCGALPY